MSIKICLDAGHYGKYNRSPAVKTYYESDMNWKLHSAHEFLLSGKPSSPLGGFFHAFLLSRTNLLALFVDKTQFRRFWAKIIFTQKV